MPTGRMAGTLSTFPDLELLQLDHLPAIRALTACYPSYSDFDVVNLWTWSAPGPIRVGQLYGNLVVEFCDYVNGEAFLSFIGATEVGKTALTLLEAARGDPGLRDDLQLVPELTVEHLRHDPRIVGQLEKGGHDYLYSPRATVGLQGAAYRHLRHEIHRFERASTAQGGIVITSAPLELLSSSTAAVDAVLDGWSASSTDGPPRAMGERQAIGRLCASIDSLRPVADLRLHVAVHGSVLRGFIVSELVDDSTITAHFCKSDGSVDGLMTRLVMEVMQMAATLGVEVVNAEQDLGIDGIRFWKEKLNPIGYLHKYRVALAGG